MFNVALLPRNLKACEVDLQNKNPKVRLAVLADVTRSFAEEEREQRVRLVVSALSDENADVRRRALVSLADLGATGVANEVSALLADVEIKVRQMAVMCLGEIAEPGDPVVLGRLASLLRAGDPSVRYQALLASTQLAPADSAGDLLNALSDTDKEVRELAIRLTDEVVIAGGLLMPVELGRAVIRACADEAPSVRLVAQLLCGDQGWDAPRDMILEVVARRFRTREPRDEQSAVELSGRLGMRDAIESLERRGFGRWGFSADPFRYRALVSLTQLGQKHAYAKLLAGLSARDYVVRTMAVQGLGETGITSAIPHLQQLRDLPARVDQEVLYKALERLKESPPLSP